MIALLCHGKRFATTIACAPQEAWISAPPPPIKLRERETGEGKERHKSYLKIMRRKEVWVWLLAHVADWKKTDQKPTKFLRESCSQRNPLII